MGSTGSVLAGAVADAQGDPVTDSPPAPATPAAAANEPVAVDKLVGEFVQGVVQGLAATTKKPKAKGITFGEEVSGEGLGQPEEGLDAVKNEVREVVGHGGARQKNRPHSLGSCDAGC